MSYRVKHDRTYNYESSFNGKDKTQCRQSKDQKQRKPQENSTHIIAKNND